MCKYEFLEWAGQLETCIGGQMGKDNGAVVGYPWGLISFHIFVLTKPAMVICCSVPSR
jgi:hypothetical protein